MPTLSASSALPVLRCPNYYSCSTFSFIIIQNLHVVYKSDFYFVHCCNRILLQILLQLLRIIAVFLCHIPCHHAVSHQTCQSKVQRLHSLTHPCLYNGIDLMDLMLLIASVPIITSSAAIRPLPSRFGSSCCVITAFSIPETCIRICS